MSEPSERYAGHLGGRLTWSEINPIEGARTWVLTLEGEPVDGLLVDDDVWGFELDDI